MIQVGSVKYEDERTVPESMSSEKTLEETVSMLESFEDLSWQEKLLVPPRIARSTLDFSIDTNVDGVEKFRRASSALDICVLAYKGDIYQLNVALDSFKDEFEDMMSAPVVQKKDLCSWLSYINPNNGPEAASTVLSRYSSTPVTILGISHGGLPPSVDIYNRLVSAKEYDENPTIYTFRLSANKQGDKDPQLTDYENDWIQYQSRSTDIVLVDEDVDTGGTLLKAERHMDYLGISNYSSIVFDNEMSWLNDSGLLRVSDLPIELYS